MMPRGETLGWVPERAAVEQTKAVVAASAPIIVGIAGGTGAGKTLLGRVVARELGDATLVDLDAYYRDRRSVPMERRARLKYDEPDAFDVELLISHLDLLRQGQPIRKPRYSFAPHLRFGSKLVRPARTIILEGLFVLHWEGVRQRLDLGVFVDASDRVRVQRRIRRDVEERGRTPRSVLRQYEGTVQPMHSRYVEPTRALANLVVRNEDRPEHTIDQIISACRAVLASPNRHHRT